MDLCDLIKEYEDFMGIKLSLRERFIFTYAYTVGVAGLDKEDNDKYVISINLEGDEK